MSNSTQTNPTLNKNLQPHNETFIYVRSAHDQVSLHSQARLVEERATSLGYKCNQVFVDSCSGMKDPMSRPGFSNLIQAIRATPPTISTILMSDRTRIARSPKELSTVENLLKQFGVDIVYVEESVN